jgi:multiple sugar transport system substrate-binding protein
MGGTVSGVALPLGPDGRMAEHFASLSAPYVIGPANTFRYWFDPDDMSPLCASQGHARAANMLKELARLGPATMTSWTLGDSWEYFVKGNAVFTYAWGGVTQLAIGQKQPTVGKIAAALPGTLAYVDPKTGQETKVDAPNLVGNTTGDSWAGVVMSSAPEPDLVYYLFALLATEPKQRFLAARVADGVNPGSVFQFPKPVGTGDIDDYLSQGWNEQDARDYTTALSNNYANKLQLPYLRIPGAERYWSALDNRLAEFLSDRVATAEAALQQVADDWNGITDDLDRESQRLSYLTTLGLPLPSSGD